MRGGRRENAGRKAEDGAADLCTICVNIRDDQRQAFLLLGGSTWVRKMIDREVSKTTRNQYFMTFFSEAEAGIWVECKAGTIQSAKSECWRAYSGLSDRYTLAIGTFQSGVRTIVSRRTAQSRKWEDA